MGGNRKPPPTCGGERWKAACASSSSDSTMPSATIDRAFRYRIFLKSSGSAGSTHSPEDSAASFSSSSSSSGGGAAPGAGAGSSGGHPVPPGAAAPGYPPDRLPPGHRACTPRRARWSKRSRDPQPVPRSSKRRSDCCASARPGRRLPGRVRPAPAPAVPV